MLDIDKAALLKLAGGWVVKKSASSAPQKLTEEDCAQLVGAAYSHWQAMQLGSYEDRPIRNALYDLTKDWIVQRERGAVPGRLADDDFRAIIDCLGLGEPSQGGEEGPLQPEQLVEPEPSSALLPEGVAVGEWRKDFMPADLAQETDVLADGRRVKDVLEEDPFYFARQHLALSL
ncbi:hypothetical protein BG621_08145 [Parasaccharibacter apium]|nr:hypothetical protein BG621_08145 [Parasaccharibacter apium]